LGFAIERKTAGKVECFGCRVRDNVKPTPFTERRAPDGISNERRSDPSAPSAGLDE
jgi:hypothetical protein